MLQSIHRRKPAILAPSTADLPTTNGTPKPLRFRARRSAAPVLAALGVAAMLGGCVPQLGSRAPRPVDLSMPDAFAGTATANVASAAVRSVRDFFRDEQLVALIEQALANNQELAMLAAEVGIADAEVLDKRGESLPKVSAGVGVGIEKVGRYTSQGASDESDQIKPGTNVPEHLGDFRAGFRATWEVDIWRKLRNASKAAGYRYLASIEGRNFAVTQLVAELARSYYELMALDNQLEVLGQNIEIQEQALQIVRVQKQAAQVTELAVQRFEAEVLRNRGRLFDIQQRIVETENRLNVLAGRFPQPIQRSSTAFLQMTAPIAAIGSPQLLLEHRPDLRRAERELEAARLDVQVAKAGFYPSFGIDAEAGVDAYRMSRLSFWPESLAYSAVGGLMTPLWNRNSLTAAWFAANLRQTQATLQVEKTIRTAYAEVCNQVSRIEKLGGKLATANRQVEILRAAIAVSSQLFGSARADYMEVLLTRRDALESQMELIETKTQQLRATVELYQALGGGWRDATDATAAIDGEDA
jgi:NodT family efflux transporter outer membrane factor (OMF) lipoprotein